MKKRILLTLVMVMCFSMLTGCAQIAYNIMNKPVTEEVTEVYDAEDYADLDDTEEAVVDEDTEEAPEADTEEVEENTEAETTTPDFEVAEATLENPAQIGEWVATKAYSAEDSQYHTMYFKITGVIRGEEAQAMVDAYNAEDHVVVMDELEYDDLEYCVVTYETYFPEDFPQGEYGIYSYDVDLSVCNLEDSGAIEGYIGLSSVWDISEDLEEDFFAGDTFTEGKAVFAMVKDFSDYLFYASYYDDDSNEFISYVKGE